MERSCNEACRRGSPCLAGLLAGWMIVSGAFGQDAPIRPALPNGPANTAAAEAVKALRNRRFADALRTVDEALGALSTAQGKADGDVLRLLILKAQACYGLGQPQEAIAALSPFVGSLESPDMLVGAAEDWNALTVLADSFMALDRWDEALGCLVRARSIVSADTTSPPRTRAINAATTLGKLGTARARVGDWDGAREAFEEQIRTLGGEPGDGGAYLAAAHNGLGLVADNGGDLTEAAGHYAIAARIYEESFGLEHPYTKRALTTLARVRAKLGDTQEADRITARLATVDAVPQSIPATLEAVPSKVPAPRSATPMPLLTPPVIAAVLAALLLVALTASGLLGRRRAAEVRAPAAETAGGGEHPHPPVQP